MNLPDLLELGPTQVSEDDKAVQRLKDYFANARSKATWRAYKSDFECYLKWCSEHGFDPIPCSPQQLCLYADSLLVSGLKISTIRRRVASLSVAHKAHGVELPLQSELWRTTWRGMRRAKGTRPNSSKPIWLSELVAMIHATPTKTIRGVRDKAIILTGWAAGMRRSEIIELRVADCDWRNEGVAILIRKSKTDQEGEGRLVPLFKGRDESLCPVGALLHWLERAQIDDGHLFRSISPAFEVLEDPMHPATISRVVKAAAKRARLDEKRYTAHSLRSGFCSSARAGGASEQSIMRITGHRSLSGLAPYLARGTLFSDNPAGKAGL
jgi:site-specific recombinase XerD